MGSAKIFSGSGKTRFDRRGLNSSGGRKEIMLFIDCTPFSSKYSVDGNFSGFSFLNPSDIHQL